MVGTTSGKHTMKNADCILCRPVTSATTGTMHPQNVPQAVPAMSANTSRSAYDFAGTQSARQQTPQKAVSIVAMLILPKRSLRKPTAGRPTPRPTDVVNVETQAKARCLLTDVQNSTDDRALLR